MDDDHMEFENRGDDDHISSGLDDDNGKTP